MSYTVLELRVVVWFLTGWEKTTASINVILCDTYAANNMPEESPIEFFKLVVVAGRWRVKRATTRQRYSRKNYTHSETYEIVNAAYCCDTLRRLRTTIRRKRPGKFPEKSSVLLFHDNARPHTAKKTQNLLKKSSWIVFNHPPYSPDIALSDYHLFPFLKIHLGGR